MSASEAVCVLGMSRSGTSLTARVLNLCGVELGAAEDLLAGGSANPGGMWEHVDFMLLNERLLKQLGGTWKDLPELPPGWQRSGELHSLREEARALVDRFGGCRLWGWKDPRNSVTLPFWQELVPRMRYVICLRNPVDVAASLRRRNRMSAERALSLWLEYTDAALRHTEGGPRIVVSYEEYFDEWRVPAERIVRFLGGDDAALGEELAGRIDATIVADHRHHSSAAAELAGDSGVPPGVLATYEEALGCVATR